MCKIEELAELLEVSVDDIELDTSVGQDIYCIEDKEYLVLTDDEANTEARKSIETSLWAFNPSFLSEITGLPEKVFVTLSALCEDANDTILEIVGNKFDALVEDAIAADARGHFISSYDGIELETKNFSAYRVN